MSAQQLAVLKALLMLALGIAIFLAGLIPKSRFRADFRFSIWRRSFLLIGGFVCIVGALYGLKHTS